MGNWNDTQEAYYGTQSDFSERPERPEKKVDTDCLAHMLSSAIKNIFIESLDGLDDETIFRIHGLSELTPSKLE